MSATLSLAAATGRIVKPDFTIRPVATSPGRVAAVVTSPARVAAVAA